jgi:threonylcarbamoyladenosine tRNA methylthiotransferase MtaB
MPVHPDPSLPSFAILTFGCRLNQGESESIARAFAETGFPAADPGCPAGILVVNTCTVTSKAEQKARRIIRLALRRDPRSILIVTGCYAELDGQDLAALGDRIIVLPGSRKGLLTQLPARMAGALEAHADPLQAAVEGLAALGTEAADPFACGLGGTAFRSRAFIKVQEGCDNACAYCRVRLARGPSRSLDPGLAVERVRSAEEAGIAEAVLTGVNLSQYDACPGGFPGLLERLLAATSRITLRISSYEPDRADVAFAEACAHPRIRPFFHFPVQSGSAAVLRRMGRAGLPVDVLRAAEALRGVKDDPFISLDMMVGFPDEGEADFEDSLALVRELAPAWIHVFIFSPRPGTPAFTMRPRVPERLSVERAARLTEIARAGRLAYAARWAGRRVDAVLECSPPASDGPAEAFSANALRVAVDPGPLPPPGSAIRLELRAIESPGRGGLDADNEDAGFDLAGKSV